MQVDISLSNVKVYNVEKIDVKNGETFKIFTDSTDKIECFSNSDAALSFIEHDKSADVTASGIGKVIVKIFRADLSGIEKTLTINVVDKITDPATDLGLSAGNPELK